jgi:hypothetical protein
MQPETVGWRPPSGGSLVGGDSLAWELTGALGPAALLRDDDTARCGGQDPRSTTSGGWHSGIGRRAVKSAVTETRAEARVAWM